jgi:glyoxylase-like metal-dependent hydrolase (beta-lactamase superfamily II)
LRGADGITAVDAGYVRPLLAAVHIVEHGGRAALVDTGTTNSVPAVLAELAALGYSPADVEYVLLTHVHLDHAGGAGAFMRAFPNATAIVHPRGAPHLIEPSKLIAGTIAVYGEALYAQLYGEIVPIPADRLRVTQDGERLAMAGRTFEFWHTPGHAMHHQVIVDHASRAIFTGDNLGISYRDFDTARGPWVFPTTTPTQFDPDQLTASIARIASFRPRAAHLTHYARVGEVDRLAADMTEQVRDYARIATANANASAGDRFARIARALREDLHRRVRAHGCTMDDATVDELLKEDIDLNTQGLVAWLERRSRA